MVLPGVVELDDQLDQPLLGARIERRGRLVEDEHLGVHHEHRRDRDPLLLSARQLVRRPIGDGFDREQREGVGDPTLDLFPVEPHVQRSERDLVAHGR